MKVVVYEIFVILLKLMKVVDFIFFFDGVVVRVMVIGVCWSDWYGWMGYDKDIILFYVFGYEFVGVVEVVGFRVEYFKVGD